LVLGEALTWNEPIGAVIVLASVWFASMSAGTRVWRRRRAAQSQQAYAR
jgi:hypothetical protein